MDLRGQYTLKPLVFLENITQSMNGVRWKWTIG